MLSSISTLRFCAATVAKNPVAGAASTSSSRCSFLLTSQRRLQSSSSGSSSSSNASISTEPMFAKFGKFLSMNISMSPTTVAVANAAIDSGAAVTSVGPEKEANDSKSAAVAVVGATDGYAFENFDFYVVPSASASSSSSLGRSILSTPSLMNGKPPSLHQKVLFSRGSFCGGGVRLSSFRCVPATTGTLSTASSSSSVPTTIVANGYLFDSQAEHRRAISGGSNTVMAKMPLSVTMRGRVGGASSSSDNAAAGTMGPRVFSPTVDATSELFSVDMAIESALAATRAKQLAAKSSSVGGRRRRFTSSSAYPITSTTNASAPSTSSSSLKRQLAIVAAAAAKKKARMEVALRQQVSAAAAANRENSCASSSKRTKLMNTKLAM